jgi:4-aminobutyrate aminotransferase-like enzyme/Ser/Thr protein kinase RdoA (MazF antagonist)
MNYTASNPPRFTETQVKEFVDQTYGLDASVDHLASDIGQNFLVQNTDGFKYIFKIANPSESADILNAQNEVLIYLADQSFKKIIPKVIPTLIKDLIASISTGDGTPYNCRLLSYLEGTFLADYTDQSPTLLQNIGEMLGKMDQTLKKISNPAIHRYWHWDLKNILDIRPYTCYLSDPGVRRLVEYFLLQFETLVLPRFSDLPQSVIHNDANDHNILIPDQANDKTMPCTIIDFGDMVYSCTIFELAIALSYIMFKKEDPLLSAIPVIKGYIKRSPLTEEEISILYYCIAARCCQSLTMAAYQRKLQPDNDYLSISEQDARELLFRLVEINPEQAEEVFRQVCGFPSHKKNSYDRKEILGKRSERIGKSFSISYKKPLKIIKGAMQYLYEENGQTFLDCVNNVCHVGHCHPRVVLAAQKQLALLNTNTRYLHDNVLEYAKQLTDLLPDPLNVCFFVNSGSEANELALRLAYNYTNSKEIIILDNAYHGNTSSLIDISPYKYQGKGGRGPGHYTHKAMMPDLYRGPFRREGTNAGSKYAESVSGIIGELQYQDKSPAAFMCESLPGCGGQILLPDQYLETVYQFTRKAGGVCIADEVQVGFGRVGKKFWGFELQNVIPDIITLGKPIGNGHPLAAVVTTSRIADAFNNGMEYFNTFGGNPVSCAIGMAVLDVIKEEDLQGNAERVGKSLMKGLQEIRSDHEIIGDVRGSGLFIGIELVKNKKTLEPASEEAARIVNSMRDKGILLSTDGPDENVIKIKPPLVFDEKNADRVVSTLSEVLSLTN